MKFVFPILRMNWYRVLATTIDAALAAGHEVECWHSVGGYHWAANRPDAGRVPHFHHGVPTLREYDSDPSLLQLLTEHAPDAVFALCPPWSDQVCARFHGTGQRPMWITVATNDSFLNLTQENRMIANSLIILRTKHEESCILNDHKADFRELYDRMIKHPELHSDLHTKSIRARLEHPWNTAMLDHFKAHVVRTGYPLLDSAINIDAAAVRSNWGLPKDGPIIGCLSSPYGNVLNLPWEKAFAAGSMLKQRYWDYRWQGLKGILAPPPCERDVMQALKRFCDRHNAPLVVKLRHSQDATPWMRKLADKIVGEESYYPHSAVELAGIASVMFGFFTTGAPEAIAAGHSFVNLGIPGYNREDWERTACMFVGMFDHPGVAWTLEPEEWVQKAASLPIEAFHLQPAAHRAYADKYCGPLDGHHATRVIYAVEQIAGGRRPAEIPCDANHYVKLPA